MTPRDPDARRGTRYGRLVLVLFLLAGFALTGGLLVQSTLAVDAVGSSAASEAVNEHGRSGAASAARIDTVSVEGDGYIVGQEEIVQNHSGVPYVWHSESLTLTVAVSQDDINGYELCGETYDADGERVGSFDCERFHAAENETAIVTLWIPSWPEDVTGEVDVYLELRPAPIGDEAVDTDDPLDERTVKLYVIDQEGDLSGDGLTNAQEVEVGTDFTAADTAGNGLTDWEEVQMYGTDPLRADTTGDGIGDGTIVRLGLDPTEPYIVHKYALALFGLFLLGLVGTIHVARRTFDAVDGEYTAVGSTGASGPLNWVAGSARPFRSDGSSDESAMRTTTDEESESTAGARTDGVLDPENTPLTDGEYVCRLLAASNGRLKQSDIVDRTDWSKAKVSRVLSQLEEEEKITKLRVGRENIVELSSDVSDHDVQFG